jgi:hypothetical protein
VLEGPEVEELDDDVVGVLAQGVSPRRQQDGPAMEAHEGLERRGRDGVGFLGGLHAVGS